MAAAIGLREDYDAGALRALAKRAKDGPQARRLLALASIYDGAARSGAAENGGVGSRSSAIGLCASTPMVPTDSSTARRPDKLQSSMTRTAPR